MLRVSCQHQLTAPGVIRVQKVRYRDDTLRLGRMAGFVNENVREMIARKTCRDQPENKGLRVYLYVLRLSVYTILDNIVPILLIDFT